MNMEIYYYSGTGNSLYVAKELQKKIPGSHLLPIVRLLKNKNIKTTTHTAGFIFPNFCLTLPVPVHDFLKKVDLASTRYLFAVCTRGGSRSEAFDYMNIILKKQSKRLHAQLDINMPWNIPFGEQDLVGANTEERMQHLDAVMHNKLTTFSQHIISKKEFTENKTNVHFEIPGWQKVLFSLSSKSFNYKSHRFMYQKLLQFYSDSHCNGCGICENVCLSQKITMINKKPVWNKGIKCYACFACINFCPRRAIQIDSKIPFVQSCTEINGRYHHKSVTYKDIAGQK
jgi:ferredoxin